VLGASFDTPAENKAFADEHGFGYRLLSDVDKAVGQHYEVVREPGADFADFAQRIAYLVDPDGVIRRAYQVTDTQGFAALVLDDLDALRPA
jgi:peroxiredoxin Q/BCP